MDMRQAAEYFKTRWQWRAEAASVRERYAKEFEARKAEVASRKAAAKLAADGGGEPPQPNTESPAKQKLKLKPDPKPEQTVQTTTSRKDRRESEQQRMLATYVNSVVDMLEYSSPAGTSRDAETTAALSAALALLDRYVSPEDLLSLSKKVKAATGDDQRESFLASSSLTSQQVSYWKQIEDEVKHLEAMQGKGDKLEWSSKFASDSISIIEAFLGPAGPMFKTARELYGEYKESFKSIKERWTRMSEWLGDKKSMLGKRWVSARLKSGRMFSKISTMFSRFGGLGSKLWKGAAGAVSKFAKPLLLLAGGLATAFAAFTFKDEIAGKAKEATDWVGEKYSGVKSNVKATVNKALDKAKSFIDTSPTLSRVKGLVSKTANGIGKLHAQAVDWVSQKSANIASVLTNKYTLAIEEYEELKVGFLDTLGSVSGVTSGVFSKMTGFFEEVWSRIKKFVPNWLRRAYNKAKDVISKPEASVKGGATAATSDPGGGDGVANANVVVASPSAADSVKPYNGKINSGSVRGVSLAGVNPNVQQSFLAMTTEFESLTGRKVQVNSGKRSTADQERLYRTMPGKAARPGYSMHEFGLAIDANSAEVNQMTSLGLMQKYGFATPVPGEPWHIEPVSIQKYKRQIRAAKDEKAESETIAKAVGLPVGGGATGTGDAEMVASEPGGAEADARVKDSVNQTASPVYNQMAKNQASMLAPNSVVAQPKDGRVVETDIMGNMAKQVMQALGAAGGVSSIGDMGGSMAKQVMQAASSLGPAKDMEAGMSAKIMSALDQVKTGSKTVPPVSEALVMQHAAPVFTPTAKASPAVAPQADTSYKQAKSKAKGARMPDVQTEAQSEAPHFGGGSNVQTSANSISLWLGDPGMLTLNLGIGA